VVPTERDEGSDVKAKGSTAVQGEGWKISEIVGRSEFLAAVG